MGRSPPATAAQADGTGARVAGLVPLLCALLSGAAGLLYQVIWNHELLLLFGSTSAATAAVVAAFMGGMSLGAWGVRRLAADHARLALGLYAAAEIGVALYALSFHALLSGLQALYPGLWHMALGHPALLELLRLGLGLVILAPPTVLMGATLPLLVAALQADRRWAAKSVGWIYGLNAGGGALGAAATGLVLLPLLGLTDTRLVGVGLSAAAASLAWLARRPLAVVPPQSLPAEAPGEVTSRGNAHPTSRGVLLAVLAGAGFASMGYEVLWTRMLVLITGSSTYAFSLMLALYVVGIAVGSLWLAGKVARLRAPADAFAHLEIAAALLVLAGLWLFARFPDWQLEFYRTWGATFDSGLVIDAILAALIIVPPTLLLGAAFPVAVEALGAAGRRTGT
ncbi:spermine synthase, partial [mine drainage metagenome]